VGMTGWTEVKGFGRPRKGHTETYRGQASNRVDFSAER